MSNPPVKKLIGHIYGTIHKLANDAGRTESFQFVARLQAIEHSLCKLLAESKSHEEREGLANAARELYERMDIESSL